MVLRVLLLASTLLLAGCVTHETRYVYDDRYARDEAGYVVRDGSRYAPARDGYGDYYVGQPGYRYVDDYYYPSYMDWPAYYSLFWGFNRWYYDPFYYPGYYYGITYYPRHYLSFRASWNLHLFGAGHRYFPYSPYRYAWYDHYYDWSYWHHAYPWRYHNQRPRYGSARNEAERLAWRSRGHEDAISAGRAPTRQADYSSHVRNREAPRLGAFDEAPRRAEGRALSTDRQQRLAPSFGTTQSSETRHQAAGDVGRAASARPPTDRQIRSVRSGEDRRVGAAARPDDREAPAAVTGAASRNRATATLAPVQQRAMPERRTQVEERGYTSIPLRDAPARPVRQASPRESTPPAMQREPPVRAQGGPAYAHPAPASAPARSSHDYGRGTSAPRAAPEPRQPQYSQTAPAPYSRGTAAPSNYAVPRAEAPRSSEARPAERSGSTPRSESRRSRDRRERDDD